MCVVGYRGSAPGIKTAADRYPAINDTLNVIATDDSITSSEVFKPGVVITYRAGILKFQICLLRKQITQQLTLGDFGVAGMHLPNTTTNPISTDNPQQQFSLQLQNMYHFNNDTWQIVSVEGFNIKATKVTGDGPKRVVVVARCQEGSYDILRRVQDFYRSDSSSSDESESDTGDLLAHPA